MLTRLRIQLACIGAAIVLSLWACSGGGGGGGSGSAAPEDLPALTWDAPALDSDGAPLTNLSGYKVYRGENPGDYTSVTYVSGSTPALELALDPGIYYFVVTAYDSQLDESGWPEIVVVTDDYGNLDTPLAGFIAGKNVIEAV